MRIWFRRFLPVVACAALSCAFKPAAAATIEYTVNFTAEGFRPSGAPVSPVAGEFKFSLDTALGSSGLVMGAVIKNALNVTVGSLSYFWNQPANQLVIGGDVNGAIVLVPGSNDIYLSISNFTSGGSFGRFVYSRLSGYYGEASRGTVQVSSPPVAATPLPAALPLFGAALWGLGFAGWRRRKTAAA